MPENHSALPSPRLFIHIGTHKTGSTSIQALLRENAKKIAAHGITVITDPPEGVRTNCTAIAHAFIRPELWTPSRMSKATPSGYADPKILDHFAAQIRQSANRCFVVSAEAFCYLRTKAEREHLLSFLAGLGCRITPVAYMRNGENWRESWSAWLDKLDYVRTFRAQHPENFNLLDDWYFDHAAIVRFWKKVDPSAVFYDYDKLVARQGSVIPSFLRLLGLPATVDSGKYFLNQRHFQGIRR